MISLGKKWLSSILTSPFTVRPRALLSAVFTSPDEMHLAENTTSVQTVTATGNGTVNFSLLSGDDSANFRINGSTAAVTLIANPDFEAKSSYRPHAAQNERFETEPRPSGCGVR